MSSHIPVIEIFGPTVQGEGMAIGRKTMFVRTAGCDYRCNWCDSAFTWDGSARDSITKMSAEAILAKLTELAGDRFNHVTISGGNPALYPAIDALVRLLQQHHIATALETQGSKWQPWFNAIDELTLSPKPPSSGMVTDFSQLDDIIDRLRSAERIDNHVSLKIVIFDDQDLAYAQTVHERYQDIPFFLQVGNDDSQTTEQDKLMQSLITKYEWLVDQVVTSRTMVNVRVLPQLHTLVWGNKRGV